MRWDFYRPVTHRPHLDVVGASRSRNLSAHAAVPLYAEAFEKAGAFEHLEAFLSFNGADFYGVPRNTKKIKLVKEPWRVPETYVRHLAVALSCTITVGSNAGTISVENLWCPYVRAKKCFGDAMSDLLTS